MTAGSENVTNDGRRRGLRSQWMALLLLVPLVGCGDAEAPSVPAGGGTSSESTPRPTDTATIAGGARRAVETARGRELYAKQCASCHGATGRGDGPVAWLLSPKPRDFTKMSFRLVSTESSMATDEDLFATITRGMPGSAMPPWAHLSEEDRWALAGEVKRLTREGVIESLLEEAKAFGESLDRATAEAMAREQMEPGAPLALSSPVPESEVDLERGKTIYTATCAPCHDADGRGRLQRSLRDAEGYPIFARDFTQGIFKGGFSREAIARRMMAGMPGTPMPSFAAVFAEPGDLWAVVDYVRSFVPSTAKESEPAPPPTLRATRAKEGLDLARIDIDDASFDETPAARFGLMPLWWRDDQRAADVEVRAIHDGERVAVRLRWTDETSDASAIETRAFSDGAAIQLSTLEDPPFLAMGDRSAPVSIFYWKASHEADLATRQDVENVYPRLAVDHYPSAKTPRYGELNETSDYATSSMSPEFLTAWGASNPLANPERPSPVESLVAKGFGTLTIVPSSGSAAQARSRWEDGAWSVVIVFPRPSGADDETPDASSPLHIAVAVWNGSAGDRNGQKSFSIWHPLELEP